MASDSHSSEPWDVIVVGSGAGGMAAAITAAKHGLKVIVLEKEAVYGGTTARSGGMLWIPGNSVSAEAGVHDDVAAAKAYMKGLAGNAFDSDKVDAFLREGPEMIDFFRKETSVQFFSAAKFPDYRSDVEGWSPGGRSVIPVGIDSSELGNLREGLRPPLREITLSGMMFSAASAEIQHFYRATRSAKSALYVVKRLFRHFREVAKNGRATSLSGGNALAARLAKSAADAGVTVALSTRLIDLVMDGGRVIGVKASGPSGEIATFTAGRGVVLAGGGFPQGASLQRDLFPHVKAGGTHLSPGSPGNTGDTLQAAARIGAHIERRLPDAAAWIPTSKVPHPDGAGAFPHLLDRYKPGVIAVDPSGRRFVNEAESYHEVGRAMLASCRYQNETYAWLLCDHRALRRFGMGYVKPFPIPFRRELRSGYLLRGHTVAALARKIGADPSVLVETFRRYNADAVRGEDPQFHRGDNPYNRYLGDPDQKPNPTVAPLDHPPYYAIKLYMGDLGTFAGLAADMEARVLNGAGEPIPGLFTAGNDMASVMGGAYPGPGITLGPAMTFGYVAGKALAKAVAPASQKSTKSLKAQ